MSYNVNASIEDYIESIRVTLKSLIETLDKKLNRYSKLPTPIFKEVAQGHEKIKWNKNQNALAYLISNLHEEKYIKLPSNGDEIHYSKAVELILNTFSFNKEKVNIDRFTREFNLKSNTYKIKPNDPLLKLLEILDKVSD
jgi:hypothetical protein